MHKIINPCRNFDIILPAQSYLLCRIGKRIRLALRPALEPNYQSNKKGEIRIIKDDICM